MSPPDNVMQVFSLLDKSNCKKCGEKTCLAFASAVFRGEKNIALCPTLTDADIARFTGEKINDISAGERENAVVILQQQVAELNLQEAASRTGGNFTDGRLTIKILGKDFAVDSSGSFYSDIHIIPWVTAPFLSYVLNCQNDGITGEWISFRELAGGREHYPLFRKRCEEGMKRVADVYTDLFDDIVHLFQGRQVESLFQSDISVVLPVFPKVPLAICYWRPDDGLESSLNVFFDQTIDTNLGAGSAFSLAAGLTQMFEKIAIRHGRARE